MASRNPDKLPKLAEETAGVTFACEATEPEEVAGLFDVVIATIGVPDIVVYNASARARGPVTDLIPEEVARAIAVSAYGGFLVAQQAARHMVGARFGCDPADRGLGQREGLSELVGVRDGQVRAARPGAEHGARAVAAGRARRAFRHRRRASAVRRGRTRTTTRTACSTRTRSPKPTGRLPTSSAAPGPGRSNCGRGWRGSS